MKAIVWTKYGDPDVLVMKNIPKPIPKDNEVLIKVHATTVTSGDCEMRRMKTGLMYRFLMRLYIGLWRPKRIKILGMELAGEIEKIGNQIKHLEIGDQVFASTGFLKIGANAEYICLPEEFDEVLIVKKPHNMTYEEAATVPVGGVEALNFLKKGKVQSGHEILINGAGGTIGTFAIQLAKHYGANVTTVDSADKLSTLNSIGADYVIDYTKQNFSKIGKKYDFIIDLVQKSSFTNCLKSLKKNGRLLIANPTVSKIVRGRWVSITSQKKVVFSAFQPRKEHLIELKNLVEAGNIRTIISKSFRLEDAVKAHLYVESGLKTGNVVLKVE